MSIQSTREFVTPDKARAYLELNTRNRPLRAGKVRELALAIQRGEWHEEVSPITFGRDGSLNDGQHRLHAIVTSGIGVWMIVWRNCDEKANMFRDTQTRRTDADAFMFAGTNVSTSHVATAKRMMNGPKNTNRVSISRLDLLDFIHEHFDALNFARPSRFVSKVCRADNLAVIARAFYHEDEKKLSRFKEVYLGGPALAETAMDSIPLLYRDYAIGRQAADATSRTVGYRVGQSAVHAFCRGRKLQILKPTETDLYPLPE